MKEGLVPEPHPLFAAWLDLNNEDSMFTAEQASDWSENHLRACHWYVEIDPLDTPPHEIDNRRLVEPTFQRQCGPPQENVEQRAAPDVATGKTAKPKSKGGARGPSNVVATSKDLTAKGNKRTAGVENEQAASSKRGKKNDGIADRPVHTDGAQSEARSSKSHSHVTRSIAGGYLSQMRTSLVQRAQEGETFHEVVINNSVGDFLASEASMFEDFAALVHSLQYPYLFSF